MVSSQQSAMTKTLGHRSLRRQLLPVLPLEVDTSEQVEFDLSDVFGPAPGQASVTSESTDVASQLTERVYDDPIVVLNRSHSLVGPTAYVSPSMQLGKLKLHEIESSLELVEFAFGVVAVVPDEPSDSGTEELEIESEKAKCVGLDDFEVMKVVGQGAFGKVFQVKKKGTAEIYAMKVMRKYKIVEKNHAEYMKAERDILTKVDHPFIVQLRYSFQLFDGSIVAFAVLHNVNCNHGFIYVTSQGLLKICQLPSVCNYDSYWPVQKIPLRGTPHQVTYFAEKNLYALILSVPDDCEYAAQNCEVRSMFCVKQVNSESLCARIQKHVTQVIVELKETIMANTQGANTPSTPKSFIPSVERDNIVGKQCTLYDWVRRLIAHGLIQSTDPNLLIHGKTVGSRNFKIALTEVVDSTFQLWLPDGFHESIGEVGVGGFVVWLEHSIEMMNG